MEQGAASDDEPNECTRYSYSSSAWTRRSLEATNFKTSWCDSRRQFVTGELLAPLSPRDIWILSRAVLYMKQLNRLDRP